VLVNFSFPQKVFYLQLNN
jgi:hypothetical protein